MNRKKRIETVLQKAFAGWRIEIIDNSFEHIGHNHFDGIHDIKASGYKPKPNY